MTAPLRVAAIQLNSGPSVGENLTAIDHWVSVASREGAKFVVLPENFAYFGPETGRCEAAESAEVTSGPIRAAMVRWATQHEIYVLAGGWPERSYDERRPYNAATLVGPTGETLAHYRKIHLFDVTLPNGTAITESDSTTPGASVTVGEVLGIPVGITICYDLRFPELYRALVDQGAQVLCVPSAFTLDTGKDHWVLLNRARAVESQCWLIAANQWGQHGKGRSTFGHSMIIDPWGNVVAQASDRPQVIVADVDLDWLQQIRGKLPSLAHRRLAVRADVEVRMAQARKPQ